MHFISLLDKQECCFSQAEELTKFFSFISLTVQRVLLALFYGKSEKQQSGRIMKSGPLNKQ